MGTPPLGQCSRVCPSPENRLPRSMKNTAHHQLAHRVWQKVGAGSHAICVTEERCFYDNPRRSRTTDGPLNHTEERQRQNSTGALSSVSGAGQSPRVCCWFARKPVSFSGIRGLGTLSNDTDHPADAEFVLEHAKAWRPEGLAQWHGHFAACRQGIKPDVSLLFDGHPQGQ